MAISKPLAVLFLLKHNVFKKKVKCITVITGPLIGYNHTANNLNTIKISYCHVRIRKNLIRFFAISG